VAKLVPGCDPVHKVSIIPRGRALGVTLQIPTEDIYCYTKEMLDAHLKVLMGGRAAEELIFNTTTTGAGNDLARATDTARKMVCEWGMSEKMGPLNFGRNDEMVFLGRDFAQHKEYSEQTALEIDSEIKRIVMENYDRAKKIVLSNLDKLKVLAEALLERETLDAADIDVLFAGGKLEATPPVATFASQSKNSEQVKAQRPDTPAANYPIVPPTPEKA